MSGKHVLGPLCKRGHDHEGTGQSLRYRSTRQCVACMDERRATYDRAWYQAHADEQRAKSRQYYQEHRARYLEQMAQYRKTPAFTEAKKRYETNNAERLRAMQREWKRRNPEKVQAMWRDWAQRNAEHLREKSRAWAQSDRGRMVLRAMRARQRARKQGTVTIPYGVDDLFALFSLFEHCCAYCDEPAVNIDHVVALFCGGIDALHNIVPCCNVCNPSKKRRDVEDWYRQRPSFTEERWEKICAWCAMDS